MEPYTVFKKKTVQHKHPIVRAERHKLPKKKKKNGSPLGNRVSIQNWYANMLNLLQLM